MQGKYESLSETVCVCGEQADFLKALEQDLSYYLNIYGVYSQQNKNNDNTVFEHSFQAFV